MKFSDLGLSAEIIKALDENKIFQPSEIQEKAIPLILNTKKNLLGIAQTGTGKTAAFGLPILQQIDPKLQHTQVLVLVPTRELGQQVAKDLFTFSRYIVRIRTEAVFGGQPLGIQLKKLETPKHVIVATPGRLLDLLSRKAVELKHLKFLVLDEADVMLNMGFKADIDQIVKTCNPKVRKLLFTSTLPDELKRTADAYLGQDLEEIRINPQESINNNIENHYIAYQFGYKFEYLKAFLSLHPNERGIVFCRTQAAAKLLGQQLVGFKVSSAAIYGDLSQYERNKIMSAFKSNRVNVLIATDLAARGVDIKELNYVIHYHLPEQEEQYVNRSGRTARAGKAGKSICMLQEDQIDDKNYLEDTLRIRFTPLTIKVEIEKRAYTPITLSINIGTRQEFTIIALKEFLIKETGLKEDNITDVCIYRTDSTFVIDAKHETQVLLNIKGKKRFHQSLKISRVESKEPQ